MPQHENGKIYVTGAMLSLFEDYADYQEMTPRQLANRFLVQQIVVFKKAFELSRNPISRLKSDQYRVFPKYLEGKTSQIISYTRRPEIDVEVQGLTQPLDLSEKSVARLVILRGAAISMEMEHFVPPDPRYYL